MFRLELGFKDGNGSKKTMSVSDVKENLTQSDAQALGEAIAASRVFKGKTGVLEEFVKAQLVETKSTVLFGE